MPAHDAYAPPHALRVYCLCAQWCGTCTEYRTVFEAMAAQWPAVQWQWVDIEDEADRVDPVEVENFPTLLITQGEIVRFFGTVMPHAGTLQRLVQNQLDGSSTVVDAAEVRALAQRLQAASGG
ncbi:MAG: thioredoxin domain-containing protein [Rhodoferax sp.]